jgi:Zn-dependent protease with chaperone function
MITANYFDGRSARLHAVELAASAAGIALAGSGIARLYPLSEVRIGEPFAHASTALYFADGARCEVSDPLAGRLLADALGYRPSRVVRWQGRWPAALAALVLLLAALAAAAIWGVPAVAERIAAALPPSIDRTLGQGALRALESQQVIFPSRFSEQRVTELNHILRAILPAHSRLPVRLLVRASPRLGPNALALPDGSIVLTDEMVRFVLGKKQEFGPVETAQLAGVLAHEIGHLERRHSTRVLARTSLTAAASAALFGDFSAVAAGVPSMLLNMRYSREMETEADDYALYLLHQHGMSAVPLADLFDALEESGKDDQRRSMPRWMAAGIDFAASHPANAERSARLRRGIR